MSGTISSPVAYIDDTGIHVPTFAQILTWLQAQFQSIYGNDIYLDSDSQDGQLIATLTEAFHDVNSLAVAAYNGYSPRSATGVALSTGVKLIGMQRKRASYSSVPLQVSGDIGASISGGIASDQNNVAQWALPSLVQIPVSGTIIVTATATTLGNVSAPAGSITRIATPTRGWISVNNPTDAVPGAPVESDTVLRQRQVSSSGIASKGMTDSLIANLLQLPGVQRLRIYENNTSIADMVNNIPAGAVGIVIEGGDIYAIANTIQATKGQGVLAGDIHVSTLDTYGIAHDIVFSFVFDIAVYVNIVVQPLAGFTTIVSQSIVNEVVAQAQDPNNGSDQIGETVYLKDFYGYAKIDQSIGGRTYKVKSVQLLVASAAASVVPTDADGNLLFSGKYVPLFDASRVVVTTG